MEEEVIQGRKVITDPPLDKITFKGTTLFYRAIATKLKQGSRVFVSDMGKQQARYAKKRFSSLLNVEIVAEPSSIDGVHGYYFTQKMKGQPAPKHQAKGTSRSL